MSLYDDLADSSYLGKDQFRNQLQANSQLNDHRLDRSQIGYDDTSDSGKVNQDENFSQFGGIGDGGFIGKDDFANSGKTTMQDDVVRHLGNHSNLDNSAFLLNS
jgi:hypothetical protein